MYRNKIEKANVVIRHKYQNYVLYNNKLRLPWNDLTAMVKG